jgi:hypothetical protein
MIKNSHQYKTFDFKQFLVSENYLFENLGKNLSYPELLDLCSITNPANFDLIILDKYKDWILLDIPKFELYHPNLLTELALKNEVVAFFSYGDASGIYGEKIYENGCLIHEVLDEMDYEIYDALSMEEKDELLELPLKKSKFFDIEKAKIICKDFAYNPDLVYEKLNSSPNPVLLKVINSKV